MLDCFNLERKSIFKVRFIGGGSIKSAEGPSSLGGGGRGQAPPEDFEL